MAKKIIITGAAGLVGQNLTPLLVKHGYEVVCINAPGKNLELLKKLNPKAKTVPADLAEKGNWWDEFKNADVVITAHAQIAAPELWQYMRNNVEATKQILKVMRHHKVPHLIHLSSSVVMSVAKDNYTKTKKEAEKFVEKSGVQYVMLRPPLMYGCFDAKHLGYLTKLMMKFPIFPVPGSGKYIRQPLFVEDLCKVIATLVEMQPDNRIYNIIGQEKIYFIDLLKTIAQVRKRKVLFLKIPLPVFKRLLKSYSLLFRKNIFVPAQLDALTAGDIFPVEPWWETFRVEYTPFEKGIRKTWSSPNAKYAQQMTYPN